MPYEQDAAEAQANPTWTCDGTPVLMRGGEFQLVVPDPAVPGNLTIDTVPGTRGIWNSTAYDPTTNWVYGVGSVGGEKTIRAYDANGGVVFQTQIQDPYPDNASTYAGTVLGDGRYIIHSVGAGNGNGVFAGQRFNMWSVDPLTGAATHIGSTPVNFADFSYNPLDGFIYQVVNRTLYKFNPNTGATTTISMPGAFPTGSFGASWFDSAGFIYLFRNNDGGIFKVDPTDTSTWVQVGAVGSDGGSDGGNCVSQIDIKKDVVDAAGNPILPADRVYSAGDTIFYKFTLINNSLPTGTLSADLCDVLPADGRTYNGVWSATAPATLTSGGQAGDSDLCLEVEMPSSLWTDPASPGSNPTEVTIEVVLDDNALPGIAENQATLDHDQDGTVDLLSDDPGDGSDPRDPTTIQILGGFTISKTVEGHPVANDTDTFAVTLSCTTADGSAHTVDANSIVDATTGAAWPGATVNGFTFTHGDDVRINDLPAGTTCTTTEGSDASYTTIVDVAAGAAPTPTGATSTGTLTSDLVNDNCQDGDASGFNPFNLQIRNQSPNITDWEMIWRNRPYSTIPNLSTGAFTHTVIPAPGGLFDHVFTGTTPLGAWASFPAITGNPPVPSGTDSGCGDVENFGGVTGPASGGGGGAEGGVESNTADITIDEALANESVSYTNQTSTIQLVKRTRVDPALGLEEDGTFTFEVTCDNGLSETITATTVDGAVTVDYPNTPLVPAGATCTISETVPTGWQLITANDVELVTDSGETQTATFNNERLVADLTISKTILGLPEDEDPTSFTFDLAVECSGGFDPDPFATTGTFSVGSPLVIEDLPVGATCVVTETAVPGFNTRYSPSQKVEIDEKGTLLGITNSTGSLIIEKTTIVPSTHPIDPTGDFEFTLECSGPDGTFTETYTVDASNLNATGANGGISHTDVGVIAPGTTCSVTETPTPGWTSAGADAVKIEVTNDDPEPTASFQNNRDTGSLEITKTIEGAPAGLDLSNEPFTVDVSCSGGFTVDPYVMSGLTVSASTPLIIDDLPTDAVCTVTELPDPRFDSAVAPATVTIDTDGQKVGLTNSTSTFSLSKTTTSSTLVDSIDHTFNFAFECTNGGAVVASGSVSITTTGGTGDAAVGDLPLVPPGSTCTITENVPTLWTLTGRTGGTPSGAEAIDVVTAVEGEAISFENTLDTATLTINKDVTGAAATPALEAETFTVNVTCSGNFPGGTFDPGPQTIVEGTPIVLTGLPVGAVCTVVETADARFATTYAPTDVALIADAGTVVDITNETSTFTISKETSVPADVDPDETFTFDISCTLDGADVYTDTVTISTSAGTGTWDAAPLLPPGTVCDITETAPAGWATVGPATISITTTGESVVDAAFVNEREVGDLTITKTLLGPASDAFANEVFTADVTCVGDFAASPLVINDVAFSSASPGVIPNLPTGAVCSVVEDFDSRFATLYAPDIGDESAAQVTIDSDGAEAGITNVTGKIAVRKDTVGPTEHGEDLLGDFTYNFDCDTIAAPFTQTLSVADLTGGQGIGVITFTDLPTMANGTVCTVTETVPAGWTVTSPNPQTIIASNSPDTPTAHFVNERNTAALTVTKVLDGVPAGVELGDEPFTVDVTCTGGFVTNPYVIAGQTITANTPLLIDNLPTGAVCSVTETPDPRFATTISDPVTIDDDGEGLTVTNTTSTLTINKNTIGATTHPINLDAAFSFAVDCGADFNGTVLITTVGQTGSWPVTDSPLLPPGTTCAVTEQLIPAGWQLTSPNDVEVTTDSAAIVEAGFTNELITEPLEILKTVIGEPTDLSDEPFLVDVVCTGPFTTDPYAVPGPLTITENTPVVIPDLPLGAACTVTERPDPRFAPSYDPDDQVGVIAEGGTLVGIDNRTATLTVNKEVTGATDQALDLSGTFDIDITCTDGTALTLNMNVVDGVAVTNEYPTIPLLPDGTACTVTEVGPPAGWTLTTPNDVEVVLGSENPGEVTFVNERNTADLTVTKTVLGTPDGLDPDSLTFTVDVSCSGDFASSPLVFADQSITNGGTITFPNLPTGAVCTVVEDIDPRFAATTTPAIAATTGVTIDDDGVDVAIVNATGEIMLVKNTEATTTHPIDVTDSFTFAIDCGAAYSGTHIVNASTVTSPTTATGFLRYDDLPALPDGTACAVTEQGPPAGWTLASANPVNLVVDSAGVVTAAFTNTRDTGALTINKVLDGVPAGTDLDDELFEVKITCSGGFTTSSHIIDGQISVNTPLTITELPTDASCSVIETPDPRFNSTVSGSTVIDADGEELTVTNTTSTLSITKTTDGPTTHPLDLDATFEFAIECTDAAGTVVHTSTQTITTDAQTGTWATPDTPLLPPGTTCTVTEAPATNWTVDAPQIDIVTNSDGVVAAAFTNTRDTGSLKISKTVTGSPVDLSDEPFLVDVTCTGDFTASPHNLGSFTVTENAPLTIDDLPVGAACTVVEQADSRFLATYSPGDQVVITEAGTAVGIDNRTATLTVNKEVIGEPDQPIDLSGSFDFDATCSDGTSLSFTLDIVDGVAATSEYPAIPLLPDGTTCTVTELAPPTGWTLTTPNNVVVTLDSETPGEVTFTNERDTADLTVTKTVLGAPDGLDLATTTFTVDVSCVGDFTGSPLVFADQPIVHGETITFPNLPTGTVCTVAEDPDPRFQTITTPETAPTVGVTIADGGTDVALVNATGEVMIVKNTDVTTPHPVDVTGSFVFALDCGAAYSGTHTVDATTNTSPTSAVGFLRYSDIPALPNGADCTVTEQGPPTGWTLATANPVDLTVDSDGVAIADFTNTRDTGSLTVTKVLDGVPVGVDLGDEPFTVDISCTGGFTVDPYLIPGQTVTANTPLVIADLPTGAECTVTEIPDPRFTSAVSDSVTIDADGEEVIVTNTTSTLSITKTTDGPTTHPIDLDATFEFAIECTDAAGTVVHTSTQTITTDAQTGTWATPDTPLLPPGTTCTASEAPATGWTITSSNDVEVTTDADLVAEATFDNTRDTGSLTVNKVLDGVPAGVDLGDEPFIVDISCTGGLTVDPYLIAGQTITANTPLVIDDLPTGSECSVTETPDPRFTTSYSGSAIVDADGEEITVTNTTSTLSITKLTEGPTTHPLSLDDTFVFDVNCGALFTGTITVSTNGQTGTWDAPDTPLLPPGTTCSVAEQGPPTGWTLDSPNNIEITTDSAEIVDGSFINRRDTQDLTITKVLEGVPAGLNFDDVLFAVTVTCTGDFETGSNVVEGLVSVNAPLTIADLPTNATCEVVETADPAFTVSYAPANGDGTAATATITDAGAAVELTNTTGGIIIEKLTTVDPLHPTNPIDTFTFTVDCGAAYVGEHEITTDTLTATGAMGVLTYTDLPTLGDGTVCEITEHDETPDWALVTDRTVTLTITEAEPQVASFTNERLDGALTIDKTVVGPEGVDLSSEVFDITVTCVGDFTEDPYVFNATVSATTPYETDGLPYNAECTVEETPDPRFAVSYTDTEATVTADEPAKLSILNETGAFIIDKETFINSDRPLDPDDVFTFVITCTHGNGDTYEETVTITTVDGEGNWMSPLLPAGHECTIELIAPDGWDVLSTAVVDFTVGTDVQIFAFQSERSLVPLTISKTLASVPSTLDFADHEFDITVSCDAGFETTDYTIPGDQVVSEDASLVIDDLPVGATCTVVEADDEYFTPTYAPADTILLSATNDNSVIITNTATQALIDKANTPPASGPLAFTGVETMRLIWLSLLLLGVGMFALGARRRLTTNEHDA